MKSIKGNYILWSAVHLATGILFIVLSLFWDTNLLVENHYMYILAVSMFPAFIFVIYFNWGHKPDEREGHILRKVTSYALSAITVVLLGMYGRLNRGCDPTPLWIAALWGVALISKGGFVLYFFFRE